MPVCHSCKIHKSEILFRLTKENRYDKPQLSHICFECEKRITNVKKCGKCNSPLTMEHWTTDLKVLFCRVCRQNVYILKAQINAFKITNSIKNTIKKIDSMPNTIGSLRDTLFETIELLKTGKIEIDSAKQINETAKTIIDSCRVENEFMQIAGGKGSGFIPLLTNPENKEE